MMTDKKFYWLKLKKDFFKRNDMKIVENGPNGKDYLLFYLKLLLESVEHNGSLRFSDTIPYNESMLATITNTNVDIVRGAMSLFIELKMIDILEDETIYMNEVRKMLGSESYWAEKKRKQRSINSEVGQCPKLVQGVSNLSKEEIEKDIDKDIEIDIEKEKDIDIEIEKEKNNKKDKSFSFCSYTENNDLIIALNDFLEMRKQTKSKMTDRAIKLMLNKLDELASNDNDKIKILNQSIMNGWKGLFPLNDKEVSYGTGKQSNSKANDEVEYETEFYNLTDKPIDDNMFKYKD